jgi:hypothetical protein
MKGYKRLALAAGAAAHVSGVVGAGLDEYGCSFCISSVEKAVATGDKLISACESIFPTDICQWTFQDKVFGDTSGAGMRLREGGARSLCEEHSRCQSLDGELWRQQKTKPDAAHIPGTGLGSDQRGAGGGFDLRVSKAYGSRGYDKVRVSAISTEAIESDVFSYSEPFKYKWTQYYLNTGIATITPGSVTTLKIANENVDIYVPKEGEGVRGIIFGDPCFTSEYIVCVYQNDFDMFNRSTTVLNAIMKHDDVHFWNVLGDNFYDQAGTNTGAWFDALETSTKTKVFGSVPGNHDFWVNSSPAVWTPKDQLGNGFMQFYGQDVATSLGSDVPYDFVNDPDAADTSAENLPPAGNFFYYNQVGNIGFIGYSGAHQYDAMVPYFEEACTWASSATGLDVLLLEGHWNSEGNGCEADMTVPDVYASIAALPACQPVAAKMRYMLGHKHCNEVIDKDVGFMVGGWGMSDYACGGSFGLPIIDTTGGQFRVLYLPLQQAWPQTEVRLLMIILTPASRSVSSVESFSRLMFNCFYVLLFVHSGIRPIR